MTEPPFLRDLILQREGGNEYGEKDYDAMKSKIKMYISKIPNLIVVRNLADREINNAA